MQDWKKYIFGDQPFEKKAFGVFKYQVEHNAVYRRFCRTLEGEEILKQVQDDITQIPLLPIQGFKDAKITTQPDEEPDLIFQSSGTSGMSRSIHRIADETIYRRSVLQGFRHFYSLDDALILGYTPGYAENPHSSLVWMINELIEQDEIKKSRFLPLDKPLSQGEIDDIKASGKKLILFGAAFGLMDLVERSTVTLPANSIVIETGGMKTHRREISRTTMHRTLASGFGIDVSRIHSEYGMCELLSQAYATGGKWFRTVPWMKVAIHDPHNPQKQLEPFREGILGITDLANVHSCSFILTGDRGMIDRRGRFQVLGRWNSNNLRGCNFLIEED